MLSTVAMQSVKWTRIFRSPIPTRHSVTLWTFAKAASLSGTCVGERLISDSDPGAEPHAVGGQHLHSQMERN